MAAHPLAWTFWWIRFDWNGRGESAVMLMDTRSSTSRRNGTEGAVCPILDLVPLRLIRAPAPRPFTQLLPVALHTCAGSRRIRPPCCLSPLAFTVTGRTCGLEYRWWCGRCWWESVAPAVPRREPCRCVRSRGGLRANGAPGMPRGVTSRRLLLADANKPGDPKPRCVGWCPADTAENRPDIGRVRTCGQADNTKCDGVRTSK